MKTIHIPPGVLDYFLHAHREPGTTFVLEAGTYWTSGCFRFSDLDLCMVAPGCRIVGAGSSLTTIEVRDPVMFHGGRPTQYYEALTGGARTTGQSQSISLVGFTLRLDPIAPCIGIHLWTSSAVVVDVRVMDVFGSRTHSGPVREGFGILINNAAQQSVDGGHHLKSCAVLPAETRDGSENYTTGIYVGAVSRASSRMLPSIVNQCSVVSSSLSRSHAAFAANALTTFTACYTWGCIRAFFCDTGPVHDILIQRMHARHVQWALDLRVAQVGDTRRFITIRDSAFQFVAGEPGSAWAQAILLADEAPTPGTHIEHVELIDSQFIAQRGKQLLSKGRCRGLVSQVIESGCHWAGPWQDPVLQDGASPWEVVA